MNKKCGRGIPRPHFLYAIYSCNTMTITQPILPKEHGAWAVVIIPLLCGVSFSHQFSWNSVALAFGVIFIFLCYVPVQQLLRNYMKKPTEKENTRSSRFWAIAYGSMGILFLIPAMLQTFVQILILGCIAVIIFMGNFMWSQYHPKNIIGDLLAIAGLTLTAPLGFYAVGRTQHSVAFLLWSIHFLYFSGSVFYVYMKISVHAARGRKLTFRNKISFGKYSIGYIVFSFALLVSLYANAIISLAVVLAFVLLALQFIYGTITLSDNVDFKKLGFALLGHSIFYSAMINFFSFQ